MHAELALRVPAARGGGDSVRRNLQGRRNVECCGVQYMGPNNILPATEWKKGSAELLVLSVLEEQPRHGYDVSKLIQLRSGGALRFHVTSLYPLLHRLEKQGWIAGRWVEKAEQRRRRYYSLTPRGREALRAKQQSWKDFVALITRVTGIEHG